MSTLSTWLRSILLTSIFSFLAPMLLIGAILTLLTVVGYIPHLEAVGQVGTEQVSQFLAVFGSGKPFGGLLIISVVCSLVGALFDTSTFYRHQNLRNKAD